MLYASAFRLPCLLESRLKLFRLRRRRSRRARGWLRLNGLRLHPLEYGAWASTLGGVYRQRDGGQHERHRRPGRRFGESSCGAPRPECGLAALSTESRRNVSALPALQQHDQNDEEADDDVNRDDEVINHKFNVSSVSLHSFAWKCVSF